MLEAMEQYRAMRTAGVSREDATLGIAEVMREALEAIRAFGREWKDECGACRDCGWEERRCYPGTRNTCGRPNCDKDRPEHVYVIVCTCRASNRTWARHHDVASGF
jgi:hypothetical protein